MLELTEQQLKVFNFVDEFIKRHHAGPTLREISDGFGWKSQNSATQHMRCLEIKGYIARDRSRGQTARIARLIRILKRPEQKTSTRRRAA